MHSKTELWKKQNIHIPQIKGKAHQIQSKCRFCCIICLVVLNSFAATNCQKRRERGSRWRITYNKTTPWASGHDKMLYIFANFYERGRKMVTHTSKCVSSCLGGLLCLLYFLTSQLSDMVLDTQHFLLLLALLLFSTSSDSRWSVFSGLSFLSPSLVFQLINENQTGGGTKASLWAVSWTQIWTHAFMIHAGHHEWHSVFGRLTHFLYSYSFVTKSVQNHFCHS